MTDDNHIPIEVQKRLSLFETEVRDVFSFLKDFHYILDKEERGKTENFLDYFSEQTYTNGDTVIKVHFSTDIINGMKTAFPKLKDEEMPEVDSSISCSIWDKNAFMSIYSYIKTKFSEILSDNFTIKLGSPNLEQEIIRVIKNYGDFFKTNLISVLEKKIIYDCYTDRFYDKAFKEIYYR